ncbi:MAG: type II toxin-antitoxin system RelE/ParE family toxin, partial [Gammaproteobacteria bacterium]
MASYRLTTAAANDLMEIARYGDERFGVAQSDAYRDQLKAHFSRLAQQPKLFAA